MEKKVKIVGTSLGLIWGIVIIAGTWILIKYETTPGSDSSVIFKFPESTRIIFSNEKPTLLFFGHPKCPCSNVSLRELAKIIQNTGSMAYDVQIWFYKPKGFPVDWEKSFLYETATAIPGTRVFIDHEGKEAQNFQAMTSGTMYLFNNSTELLFRGGITRSRGHEGLNLGHVTLTTYAKTGKLLASSTKTFGCIIFRKNEDPNDKEGIYQ